MKYVCHGCEDDCVIEVESHTLTPLLCPWGLGDGMDFKDPNNPCLWILVDDVTEESGE
jgi:hypothetical protein